MARTAPVPNIPPIPGMCPSIAVLGGGGDGGGGSGDGAGDGNGNGNGTGDGNGDGANGGGNGAGSCGNGAPGSCNNCHSNGSAGDPVDVVTGEVFTIPKTDLYLPGLFNLQIDRRYSSFQRKHDIGLGWGFTHSLAWSMKIERDRIRVHTGTGGAIDFPLLEAGQSAQLSGWALLRTASGYVLRPGDEFFHVFTADPDHPHEPLLREISYRNRGRVTIEYAGQRIARVIDTAGRVIIFVRDANGHVVSLDVPSHDGTTLVFARYRYDGAGHLVEALDADGHSTTFGYDDDRRLVRMGLPNGYAVQFRYDRQGRCVETWAARVDGTVDTALDSDVPDVLADGVTKAKGIYHAKLEFFADGGSEVVDSVRVQRYESGSSGGGLSKAVNGKGAVTTRTFDDAGNVVSQTDALGATWRFKYDALGGVVEQQDPEGRVVRLERDREDRLVEMIDPSGQKVRFARDRNGNIELTENAAGDILGYRNDANGMPVEVIYPDGSRRKHEYDLMGNLVSQTFPNGAVVRYFYDFWGRRVADIEPDGRRYTLRYSNRGLVTEITDTIGRSISYDYDAFGNVTACRLPDGRVERRAHGGLGWIHLEASGSGGTVKAFYNREGWLTRIENQHGDNHLLVRGRTGSVIRECTFDGRTIEYKRDARDRIVSVKDALGEIVVERNKVGQIVKMETSDGEAREFVYDARGDLSHAKGDKVELGWLRDAVGKVVNETVSVDGETFAVDNVRDAMGRRVAMQTSVGFSVSARRDALGDVSELWTDGSLAMRFRRDAFGTIAERELPKGGVIHDELDGAARLRRRFVTDASASAGVPAGAPARVGGPAPQPIDKAYSYSPVDDVLSVTTSADGTTEYSYDLDRHLLAKRSRAGIEEFRYDAVGNPYDAGIDAPARRYEAGGRLVERGLVDYVYDARGRLSRKKERREDGAIDSTAYHYDGWNFLRAIDLPDRSRVELDYDPFARRVQKRTFRPSANGKKERVRTTRYVWDLLNIVHEIETDHASGEESRVSTYLFEDNTEATPIAQRTADPRSAGWEYIVGDINDTPEELVDAAGTLLGRIHRKAYGRSEVDATSSTSIAFRFPGQLDDGETGLHYNRYRYFDPDTGRYISTDPIGLGGGFNLYEYTPNPIAWTDPMGWQHVMDVAGFDGPAGIIRNQYTSGLNPDINAPNYCPPDVRNRSNCHTERKMLSDLENSGANLNGTNLHVRGDYPPCPNCHRAMHDFAQRHGMTIQYSYPRTGPSAGANTVTYQPGHPPAGDTPRAQALVSAYGMHDRPGGEPPSHLNPADRYGFNNWNNATATYRDQRDNP